MEKTFIDDLCKMVAINYANYIEDNYVKVHHEKLKKSAWVNRKENTIYIHGSQEHFRDLITNHGKTDDQVYDGFLEFENLRLEKLKENENKKG
ncbi:MAG: hypothetical protein V4547_18030 [Bacteroidota bacterium]